MVGLRYLLDTNTLSEPTRPQPNQHLVDRLDKHRSEVATCATVFHELIFGVERLPPSKKRTRIEEYLVSLLEARIPVLPYDLDAARWQAEQRARLAAEGITIPFIDAQIAAVAYTHDLVLVTANVSHFAPLSGVRVENWMLEKVPSDGE